MSELSDLKKPKKIKMNVEIEENLLDDLKDLCKKNNLSIRQVTELALKDILKKYNYRRAQK